MTRHQRHGFRSGKTPVHDHSNHRFENNLTVAFATRESARLPAQARHFIEMAEAGPKLFVHSRFQGDPRLDQVLNGRLFLRTSSRGPSVVTIQQALMDLGHNLPRFGADGEFGSETRAAVIEFQRLVRVSIPGFGVDGVIGTNTMEQLDLAISRLRLRKDVTALTAAERIAFVNALNEWERLNKRGQFVIDHGRASQFAHANSGFLPWHRQFILNFESQLNAIDDRVSLPYWNSTADDGVGAGGAFEWNPAMTAMIGGNGSGAPVRFLSAADAAAGGTPAVIGRELLTGPIAHWRFIDESGRRTSTRLAREFHVILTRFRVTGLPGPAEVAQFDRIPVYDAPDFGPNPTLPSFRSGLERLMHNRVHVWVGGHLGEVPVSPNDPAFFLHHCMVDRLWAKWQADFPAATYLPAVRTGDAPGAAEPMRVMNLDQATPATVTPAGVWDNANLTDSFGKSRLRVRYV